MDLNVFVGPDRADAVLDCLRRAGVSIDPDLLRQSAVDGGYARGWDKDVPVDVFFNSIPLHESASKRIVTRNLGDAPIKVLSAEDLVVLKMIFKRGKDIVDVEHLVGVQGKALDRD